MHTTQESFSKILNPLTDNMRKMQKIAGTTPKTKPPKPKEKPSRPKRKTKPKTESHKSRSRKSKKKPSFEDYLR
jgi:hypothetical protein